MSDPLLLCRDDGQEPAFGGYFVSAYPPFETWSEEQLDRVDAVLERRAPRSVPLGLYVHVPFCVRRCDYCYYRSYADRGELVAPYVDALAVELDRWLDAPYLAERRIDFVYFGGGTPSSLSAAQLERLFAGLRARRDWDGVREVTFECAPRTVTADKLRVLRDAGVNRLSLGVQQLDDRVLRANGRVHLVRDVERAWDLVRAAGFEQVNVDLMVGMVGESERSFGASLERTIAMGPESVTLYLLEIPFGTPLYRRLRDDPAFERPDAWPFKRARLGHALERLASAGYAARSAYTCVRDPSRDAFVYQDELYLGADLLGIGTSAFSYLGGVHFQNLASLEPWLERVAAGHRPVQRAHELSEHERLVRLFVLQLKLLRVELEPLRRAFGVDPRTVFADPLERCARAGLLEHDAREVRLTREGAARVDRLLRELYPATVAT